MEDAWGAKLSVLPGTGETDPQGFERVTLGTTRASAVGIGRQLIVRRQQCANRQRPGLTNELCQ